MKKINESNLQTSSIPTVLMEIALQIQKEQGRLTIVGGWVRDTLLGIPSTDYDLEVYGLNQESLMTILSPFGKPNWVGKAFGVFTMNIQGEIYDFAFPRKEAKTGVGHKGFEVQFDPFLSFEEAASRRDFTINAMGLGIPERKLIDPHKGKDDLKKGLLKHVSSAFSEDPLRALRAVQFAARFELNIEPKTQELCAIQPLEELPAERIFEEIKKLLLKSKKPSLGLEWLRRMNLLRYFPELEALIGVQQDPEWHPEGDVWVHNNMVVDEAAIVRDTEIEPNTDQTEFEKITLMLGALCHDFGKPKCTFLKEGRWRSPAHDVMGERPTRSFLKRMTRDHKLIEQVVAFVREHLKPALLYNVRNEVKPSAFKRLALKVNIKKLVQVAKADHFGRTTPDAIRREFPAGEWLLKQSESLDVLEKKPTAFLTGKMLIQLGVKPGPHMGTLIQESFELQLEGELKSIEDVCHWAKKRITA